MDVDSKMAEEFKKCREQQNNMETTLRKFGQRISKVEGHISSISHDINATSKSAEESLVMGKKNAVAIREIHEVAVFIKEWTSNFNGFVKIINAPGRLAKKYWRTFLVLGIIWTTFANGWNFLADHWQDFIKSWK